MAERRIIDMGDSVYNIDEISMRKIYYTVLILHLLFEKYMKIIKLSRYNLRIEILYWLEEVHQLDAQRGDFLFPVNNFTDLFFIHL